VRKGTWKRRLGWTFAIGCGVLLIVALTWRAWVPAVARIALEARGVSVRKITWHGKDSLKFENVDFKKPGLEAHAVSITALRPWVWNKALKNLNTNDVPVFLTIEGWKILSHPMKNTNEPPPVATRIRAVQARLENFQAKCPRAQLLNGYFQRNGKEFRFGAIDWKDGQLGGDFTWPGLNEPADFKLTKTNLIVKQLGLEIGSKINIENAGDDVRLKGYARWISNRVDFDLTFPPTANVPSNGFLRSKGISLPGRLFGAPGIEQITGTVSMVVTNGQFHVRIGEVAPAQDAAPVLNP
jgi:hypothetical protein